MWKNVGWCERHAGRWPAATDGGLRQLLHPKDTTAIRRQYKH